MTWQANHGRSECCVSPLPSPSPPLRHLFWVLARTPGFPPPKIFRPLFYPRGATERTFASPLLDSIPPPFTLPPSSPLHPATFSAIYYSIVTPFDAHREAKMRARAPPSDPFPTSALYSHTGLTPTLILRSSPPLSSLYSFPLYPFWRIVATGLTFVYPDPTAVGKLPPGPYEDAQLRESPVRMRIVCIYLLLTKSYPRFSLSTLYRLVFIRNNLFSRGLSYYKIPT